MTVVVQIPAENEPVTVTWVEDEDELFEMAVIEREKKGATEEECITAAGENQADWALKVLKDTSLILRYPEELYNLLKYEGPKKFAVRSKFRAAAEAWHDNKPAPLNMAILFDSNRWFEGHDRNTIVCDVPWYVREDNGLAVLQFFAEYGYNIFRLPEELILICWPDPGETTDDLRPVHVWNREELQQEVAQYIGGAATGK